MLVCESFPTAEAEMDSPGGIIVTIEAITTKVAAWWGYHRPLGWNERFPHATQNSAQFKTYQLLISGSFFFVFGEHGFLRVNEATECETMDESVPTIASQRAVCYLWRNRKPRKGHKQR